ncbi:TPR repeat [Chitinophaga jiangningensis]|uniref:TPR repeat n=1 Tax=Chitinophaga jiangningensis TaxID=1419482 RepID=A0A1M6VP08_9BACT|nr:SEL1-like repeat protein [Chitinophaga jiangningensis]SHK83065.1 TPR repeat [Chitinophaga jiangningensis]
MSHRLYLYNLEKVPEQAGATASNLPLAAYGNTDEQVLMMMEWGYELPPFFYPLFAGGITIAPPVYNGSEGGLYAPAAPGKEAFADFYNFLEKHADTLMYNKDAFENAKKKLLRFFETKVTHAWFHLDAWDVFNMSDDGAEGNHTAQAEDLKLIIEQTNTIIRKAIAADNPDLLNEWPPITNSGYHAEFKQLLNDEGFNYGWAVIESALMGDYTGLEIFMENGLQGLKNEEGNIVLPAEFTEIFEYPIGEELALVLHQSGKYGYVNRAGELVIPCIYEDAYDFANGFSHIVTDGKAGVIDERGHATIPAVYDNVHVLKYGVFAVKKGGEWALMGEQETLLLPFQTAEDVGIDDSGLIYFFFKIEKEIWYYSDTFHFLLKGLSDNIETEGGCYLFTMKSQMGLLSNTGEQLIPFAEQTIRYDYPLDAFIVQAKTGFGLYHATQGWLLPATAENIYALQANPGEHGERLAVVQQGGNSGLYAIAADSRWVATPQYKGFIFLKDNYVGYKNSEGKWGILDYAGNRISEPVYDSVNGKENCLTYGIAITFNSDAILLIQGDGNVRPLSAREVVDEMSVYPESFYTKDQLKALRKALPLAEQALNEHALGSTALDEGRSEDAIRHFELAASLHCFEAITDLGYLYEYADGYTNTGKAFELYKTAATLGERYAMKNLGLMYQYGRGTAPDYQQAAYWFEQAIAHDNEDAVEALADLYYYETYGMLDNERALELYQTALDNGNEEVASKIGNIYEIKGDIKNAITYYKQAAKSGNTFAKWRLGCFYTDGNGVKRDLHKAMALYQEAVADLPDVHVDIAILYAADPYFDPAEAKRHLELAKEAGVDTADEYIDKFKHLWK